MKIAIQGHPTRGKEIIQILESLGGINDGLHEGNNLDCYYELHGNIIWCVSTKGTNFKYCTLEEFEKEFPFKIGDKVTDYAGDVAIVTGFVHINEKLGYSLQYENSRGTATPRILKLYKEMKEERNITLTLDKAKEWYNKGGELREIALQAFSENELNPLPRSWEEFATSHARMGYYISSDGKPLMCAASGKLSSPHVCPSKKSAEAHLAMIQLEQLRDCYNNNSDAWGWSYSIIKRGGIPELVRGCDHDTFLRFNNETVAKEFLKNFRDLIEKAGDLI